MKTFQFFIRNVVRPGSRVGIDYVFEAGCDDLLGGNTMVRFHSDRAYAKRANEIADLEFTDDFFGKTPRRAALKAYVAMGYPDGVTFTVDDEFNVATVLQFPPL